MVGVTLHVEDGDVGPFLVLPDDLGAFRVLEVDGGAEHADGEPVAVAGEDLRRLLGSLAMLELELVRAHDMGIPTQLVDPGLEGVPGPGARVVKQHVEGLPRQRIVVVPTLLGVFSF